jgi:hydrogenase-4 component B
MALDPALGIPVAMVVRLATIVMTLALARRPRAARPVAFVGSLLASLTTGVAAGAVLAGGSPPQGTLFVHDASGFAMTYRLDGLSAWFLVVLSTVAAPVALFSIDYAAHLAHDRRSVFLGVAFNILLAAVELVLVADGVVGFLFAWELMTLATAALVATEHEVLANRRAAYLYLIMSHVATGCITAGFLVLASHAGSLSFSAMLTGGLVSGTWRDGLFALFLIGFGVKAGIIPLHVWLPEAHPSAPSNISALMSGALIKTGIYGIVRFCVFGLGAPSLSWGVVIVVLGGVSSVLGVLYALMQHDLKRLLAYHSIENIGIILLGLGGGMVAMAHGEGALAAIGIAAGLFHVLNHAVFKSLLFLGAGGVVMTTGTRNIEAWGGLLRLMPWTGFFFLIGALAISGLPPLNGFASEWLTFQSFLYGFHASREPLVRTLFPIAGAVLALTTALAAACFVKAFGITFLALPRSTAASDARELPMLMVLPQALLAALCLGLGLLPGLVIATIGRVTEGLPGVEPQAAIAQGALGMASGGGAFDHVTPVGLGVAILAALGVASLLAVRRAAAVRRVPTWGCGGELSSGTEYTATAFSKPLMMIFRAVYRPTRTVEALGEASPYFPREVRYRAEIEPTFERYVYGPLMRGVFDLADRMKVLQAGSLHAYLGYVIALVLTLVLLVWWIG